tara:strand:- start:3682 stop:4290 length:609 start_codon:yes stop_codon:yes gene_type:complete
MNISQQYKCIFIHVNKTAGRSVSTAIFGDIKEHLTSKELFNLYDINPTEERLKIIKDSNYLKLLHTHWDNYFKFIFIRNPWDRKLSDYFFGKKTGIVAPNIDFTTYIKNNHPNPDLWNSPGIEWVEDEYGEVEDDIFIGRFENLQEDFNSICNKIGFPITKLPHRNKTSHKPYWEYYTDETEELIRQKYQKDIKLFNYEFGK